VDEYGGTAGLVTIEDLLEEIVGEISDEFDTEEPEIEEVAEGEAVMDARASLDQLNQLFHMDVQGEGFDTVGGLVLTELGKIPDPDDVLEYNGLRIKVLATRGRRIKKLHVARVVEP
jgi:CBS domain containing-hemolysin-like protein